MEQRTIPALPRDLGDGLVLRKATAADVEALAAFNAGIHPAPYGAVAGVWIRDLLRGDHPTGAHEDVLLVEDSATGAIASSLCLISQTWTYGGVSIPVGRPELVGTASAYRRRGLVRVQLEAIHAWSEARGHLMQIITGIPNYYRQFGYEPALAVERFSGVAAEVPALPAGQEEPYRLRPATPDDLSLIVRLGEQAGRRSLLACSRDEALWRYEFFVRNPDSDYGQYAKVIETAADEPVGLVCHWTWIYERRLETILYEIVPGRPWAEVTPSVLRGLRAAGQEMEAAHGEPLDRLGFTCVPGHPIVRLSPGWLERARRPFYAYVRIGDLTAFLERVAPVLERRLDASPLAGHAGELSLNFYRGGVRLRFEGGRLAGVTRWQPTTEEIGDAAFPGLTFLQLLLGARTLEQLEDAFPDCWVSSPRVWALLATLFPPEASAPWPIG